jgi:hypothetical protein
MSEMVERAAEANERRKETCRAGARAVIKSLLEPTQ